MIFTTPVLLVSLVALPIIVVLHMIRRRRRELVVPSAMLWDGVLREHRRRIFFQSLLHNLPLYLQLLAAFLLAFALADPFIRGLGTGQSGDTIMILDASASMKAGDGESTRFEEAKRAALGVIGRMGSASRLTVIEAGREARILTPPVADRALLSRIVRESRPTDTEADMAHILRTAASLAEPERHTRIVLITDGAFDLPESAIVGGVPVESILVGTEADNTGITRFRFRRRLDGSGYEFMTTVSNFSRRATSVPLTLTLDGRPLTTRLLQIAPGDSQTVIVPFGGLVAGRAEASFDSPDALLSDNRAFAVLSDARTLRLLLVTPGNYFLESLLSLLPRVEVTRSSDPDDMSGLYDIVIYDRIEPTVDADGRFLFIRSLDDRIPVRAEGLTENPQATGWQSGHPLLHNVDVGPLVVFSSLKIRPDPGIENVIASGEDTLLFTYREPGYSAVCLTFAIEDSDLPIRAAFPLLIGNILTWLDPEALESGTRQFEAGQPLVIPPGHPTGSYTVSAPDGEVTEWEYDGASLEIGGTDLAGYYAVSSDDFQAEYAANIESVVESDLSRRLVLPDPAAGDAAAVVAGALTLKPLQGLLLLLAAFLLVAEWFVWERRA